MNAQHRAFRRRSAAASYDAHYGPNMTPMVDVVMVILIFFMASAVVLGPEWFVRTNLPKEQAVSTPTQGVEPLRLAIRISVDDAGAPRATVNDSGDLELAQVFALLRSSALERGPENVVAIIQPDAKARYEDVVALHALCQELAITRVGLGK